MVIRIREHIQRVLRRGNEISVRRWKWGGEEGWKNPIDIRGFRIEVPSEVLWIDANVKVRDKKKGGEGLDWECIEAFSWS
jgi:hypothetical protein